MTAPDQWLRARLAAGRVACCQKSRRFHGGLPVLLGIYLLATAAWSAEDPALTDGLGEELKLPEPPWPVPTCAIVTLPVNGSAPRIDGRICLDEEWRDAVALTGFFHRDLNALAPPETQSLVLVKLDHEFMYLAMRSPIYPRGAALRSFERRRGELEGILSGDHVAMEILPVATRQEATLVRVGSFALFWNAIGTWADFHVGCNPGGMGQELWVSGAEIANQVTDEHWETEIRLPLARWRSGNMAQEIKLPPEPGQYWSFGVSRRFGRSGANLFSTWVNDQVIMLQPYADQAPAWNRRGILRFQKDAVVVQLRDVGNLTEGRFALDLRLFNPGEKPRQVTAEACVQALDGKLLWHQVAKVEVPPGQSVAAELPPGEGAIDPRGSRFFLRVLQDDGQPLHVTPGLMLVRFDESLRTQYLRSLDMLR